MKTMALIDLTIMRRDAKSYLIISLFCALVIGISGLPYAAIAAMLSAMITLLLGFALVGADEQNGWERLRGTLPLRRRDAITGRYASIIIAGLVIAVICSLLLIVVCAILSALPQINQPGLSVQGVIEIVVAAFLGLCVSLIYLAIMLPIVAKSGLTKGVRYFPLVFVLFFIGVFTILPNSLDSIVTNLDALPFAPIVAGVIIVSLVVYFASMALSMRLYETREF